MFGGGVGGGWGKSFVVWIGRIYIDGVARYLLQDLRGWRCWYCEFYTQFVNIEAKFNSRGKTIDFNLKDSRYSNKWRAPDIGKSRIYWEKRLKKPIFQIGMEKTIISNHPLLLKTIIITITNNKMIQHLNLQNLPSLNKTLSNVNILILGSSFRLDGYGPQ